MSVGNAVVVLAAIWGAIHTLYRLCKGRRATSLLPSLLGPRAHSSSPTKVSLRAFHLSVATTRWNIHHDRLSTALTKKGNRNTNAFFRVIYTLGLIFGAIGMLVAVGSLVWTCTSSVQTLYQKISLGNTSKSYETSRLVRRTTENMGDSKPSIALPYAQFLGIVPIIPGVTVPLGDLPLIIFAVFASQVVHELGHAVAAACESLPIISAGLSFTFCIPAAFVTFPASGMKSLNAKARSRVIAAGPFHNLVFWCFLALVTTFRLVNPVSVIFGYRNVLDVGKAVISVDQDSALSLHLAPGSIITALDDEQLAFSPDLWAKYLTGTIKPSSLGWCVSRKILEKSNACCASKNKKVSTFSCFESLDRSERGCVDPVPLLTKLGSDGRCSNTKNCEEAFACVVPHRDAELLRIIVRPSLHSIEETVVLWSGSREEVLEKVSASVRVGNWLPRSRLLPLRFPTFFERFWNYLMMATLSLYFFNLLPLMYLDGSELLISLLDLVFTEGQEAFIYDVEALEGGQAYLEDTRSRRRLKRRITKYVPITTLGLVASCIVFAVINMIY